MMESGFISRVIGEIERRSGQGLNIGLMKQISAKKPEEALEILVKKGHLNDQSEAVELYFSALRSRTLEDVLISDGYLATETLEKIIAEEGNISGELLVSRGVLSSEQLARARAAQHHTEFVNINEIKVDDELFSRFDINAIRRFQFIPLKQDQDKLMIAIDDPGDVDRIEEIESIIGIPTVPVVGVKSDISKFINLMVETSLDEAALFADVEELQSLRLITDDNDGGLGIDSSVDDEITAMASSIESGATSPTSGSDSPVVRLIDTVILKAVRKKASDIHFEVYGDGLKVKYRIDGALFEVLSHIDLKYRNFISARLKIMAGLDISEKRIPQDGRFKLMIDDRAIDFRVSVLPSIFGETVVLRILDKTALGLDLTNLGFPEEELLKFKKQIARPYGMILVAGPTGSGKTTTLYSAMKAIKTPEDKLITVEDPVEYQIPDIVQINVNEKKGLTFASGLRSIVRQDPDKILVGEIRDYETANIAINAALTGHLVLSTIHANNVLDSIGRLINMGIDPYQFVASFNLILSQRLVRKICNSCKEKHQISKSELMLIGDFEYYGLKKTFYRGRGCRFCHKTGYLGRTGIYEVMPLSDRIKSMVLAGTSPLEIKAQAVSEGMTTLRAAAWEKVLAGITTIAELNRVTFEDEIINTKRSKK